MNNAVWAGQQGSKKNTNSCPLDQQITFFKLLKSTLLIVLLKADKLMKLTEVGRLFQALMTLLAKKFILTLRGGFEI